MPRTFLTLLRWVDREARAADSDKIRTFATARRLPQAAQEVRLLPGQVDDGVRRADQCGAGRRRLLQEDAITGTSRSAIRTRIDDAPAPRPHPLTSIGLLRALLVGIDTEGDNQWSARRGATRPSRTSTRSRGCTSCSRRHGVRPTYLITYPVATRSALGRRAARAARAAATARSARTITRGKRRRVTAPTSTATSTRCRCRARQFERSWRR